MSKINLGALLALEYGSSLPHHLRSGDKYPVIGSGGIVGFHDTATNKGPGIVVGRKGSVGSTVWVDCDFTPIDTTYYVKALNLDTSLKFLYHLLNIQNFRALDSSTGIPGLNRNDAYKLKVESIELKAQSRIVEILDEADRQINLSQSYIEKQQTIRDGFLFDQIANFYRDTFNLAQIGDIATYVGSGVTPTGGSDVYQPSGIMFIRSQNVTFEGLLLNDVAFISKNIHESMRRSELQQYDVLLNITGASIGRVCIIEPKHLPANVNQHVCALRFHRSELFARYVTAFLSSHYGQKQIFKLNAGGNREGLNYQQIRKFKLPIPTVESQSKLVKVLTTFDDEITSAKKSLAKYVLLKNGISSDLLSGAMEVQRV